MGENAGAENAVKSDASNGLSARMVRACILNTDSVVDEATWKKFTDSIANIVSTAFDAASATYTPGPRGELGFQITFVVEEDAQSMMDSIAEERRDAAGIKGVWQWSEWPLSRYSTF